MELVESGLRFRLEEDIEDAWFYESHPNLINSSRFAGKVLRRSIDHRGPSSICKYDSQTLRYLGHHDDDDDIDDEKVNIEFATCRRNVVETCDRVFFIVVTLPINLDPNLTG